MTRTSYVVFAVAVATMVAGALVTKRLDATAGMAMVGAGGSLIALLMKQPSWAKSEKDREAAGVEPITKA